MISPCFNSLVGQNYPYMLMTSLCSKPSLRALTIYISLQNNIDAVYQWAENNEYIDIQQSKMWVYANLKKENHTCPTMTLFGELRYGVSAEV